MKEKRKCMFCNFDKKIWFKGRAKKPVSIIKTFLQYGFVITEHEYHYCPRCKNILAAGPNYQPRYCDQCGQHITFDGIEWKEDKKIGYLKINEGEGIHESLKN